VAPPDDAVHPMFGESPHEAAHAPRRPRYRREVSSAPGVAQVPEAPGDADNSGPRFGTEKLPAGGIGAKLPVASNHGPDFFELHFERFGRRARPRGRPWG